VQNYNRPGFNPATPQGPRQQPAGQGYQQRGGAQTNAAVPAGQAARGPQQPYARPAPQPQTGSLAQQAQRASSANRAYQQQPRGNANGANKPAPPRDNGKERHEDH
jgi:hypothetical protein